MPGSEDRTTVTEVHIDAAKRAQVWGELIASRADRRTDLYSIWEDGQRY